MPDSSTSRTTAALSHSSGTATTARVTVRRCDHGSTPLLARANIDLEGGRVCLLTFPRVLGFGFYPVSMWYCFHADGTPRAVLAEVHNTFGGRHNYLLHNCGDVFDLGSKPTVDKVFSVSPFIPMDATLRISAHGARREAACGYL